MKRVVLAFALLLAPAVWAQEGGLPPAKVQHSDAEWHKILTPQQFKVLRQADTEMPFTGKWEANTTPGTYYCAACDSELFSSDHKYNSGCGWPAFTAAVNTKQVILRADNSHGMQRTEVLCTTCHSHLGHIFDDGPAPTHKRFCINSICLKFVPKK